MIFGTVAAATAWSIFAPWRMIPAASTFVPTMNPGTSCRNTSGIPNALHRFTNRAALSAESLSRIPPRCRGWFATIPTGRPPIRARQVMIVRAHAPFTSSHSPPSTIRRITSYMSYGLRFVSGSTSSSSSSIAVGGIDDRTSPAAAPRSATGRTTGTA